MAVFTSLLSQSGSIHLQLDGEIGMNTPATIRNDFATRLYDKLAGTHAGKNLFFSPFSIRVALAMCAVGARGETRQVMTDLIGAPESVDEQNRQFAALLKSVNGEGERPFQLVTANALWGQRGYHFKPDFKKTVADFYGGAFNDIDFALPDEAMKTINTWVSDKTREKIKDLINRDLITADTRLVLTNAIYFKGRWEKVFEKAITRDEDWHGPKTCKVSMMHQTGGYLYYEGNGLQALDLPYKGGQLSMLVVLPRETNGLAPLENQWAGGDTYRQVTDGLGHEETVIVSLPRFKLETEFTLKPVLCEMHAELAFSARADFSGIGDELLAISEVVHKAFVEVNEEGTEAAAATAVGMALCAFMPQQEPKVFKADHPFLFFIRDKKTSVVLFSGRVLDPK
jgi:serpin B